MARRQTAGGHELCAIGSAARVLTPGHFAGILVQVRTRDMMMLADFVASQPGKIALRLIGAGPVSAVGATVVDPPHLIPRVKVVPATRLVGMDSAAPGDALSDARVASSRR